MSPAVVQNQQSSSGQNVPSDALKNYVSGLSEQQKRELAAMYSEEDSRLEIRLPRQEKEYYMRKLGLITYPEDIESLSIFVEREGDDKKKDKGGITLSKQVSSKKVSSEMDEERSLMEASKYTQFIAQCSGLRKFHFGIEYQQYFMDYSDLLFYSLESLEIEDISLTIRGLSKSKNTLAKILKSVKQFKSSTRKLSIKFSDIFLNDETFTALFLLIKHAPQLEELVLDLDAKIFIQFERAGLLLRIIESAQQLKKLTIRFVNMRLLLGELFSPVAPLSEAIEPMGLQVLNVDLSLAQTIDQSFFRELVGRNQTTLREVNVKVNADNSIEELCFALYNLPSLYKLNFECTKYLREEEYKTLKGFLCKKSSLMYVTIKLDQAMDIMFDKSSVLFKRLPNLCKVTEISEVKSKKKDRTKKMCEYFIGKFIEYRRNYVYSLLALKNARKIYRKSLPRDAWDDILNDFITFETLEQLIDPELLNKQNN